MLQDDYVKFLRFAQWKIEQAGKGLVGMVTNENQQKLNIVERVIRFFTDSGQKKESTMQNTMQGNVKRKNYWHLKLVAVVALALASAPFLTAQGNEFSIEILTIDDGLPYGTEGASFATGIAGAVVFEDNGRSTLRVYYQRRIATADTNEFLEDFFIETTDPNLESWTEPEKVTFTNIDADGTKPVHFGSESQQAAMTYMRLNGQWIGITSVVSNGESTICALISNDGKAWEYSHDIIQDWKLDTRFSLTYDPNLDTYVVFGRVRGAGTNPGNWGHVGSGLNNKSRYIDRRGVSRHVSPNTGTNWEQTGLWSNAVILDPMDFFNDYQNISTLESNIPDHDLGVLGWDPDKLTDVEMFDFYAPNMFYNPDTGEYEGFVIVNHRDDKRWSRRDRNTNAADFSKTIQDNDENGRFWNTNWRPIGPWYPVLMRSNDGINWSFDNDTRVNGMMPSIYGIAEEHVHDIPSAPYVWGGFPDGYNPTVGDNKEPHMIDAFPGYIEWGNEKHIVYVDSGRQYGLFSESENIVSSIYIKEVEVVTPPPEEATMFSTDFDAGYNPGDLDGQNNWTTNNADQGSWQIIAPDGDQPAATLGEQYLAVTKTAGQGSPRAYQDLIAEGGSLTTEFNFGVRMAYAGIDTHTSGGIFLGVYLNNEVGSEGVIFGFTEIGDDIHLAYRDDDDYYSLGLAEEHTFYNFQVSVKPQESTPSYDISVTDLSGDEIASAAGAASRNGLAEFSLIQLAVGTGDYGGTLYVDGVNPPEEATTIEISDWNDLNNVRNDLAGDYILVNNLDSTTDGYGTQIGDGISGVGWDPIGDSDNPFTGTFDGNGYVIKDLYINRPNEIDVGLFGFVRNGLIENLGLTNVDITGATSAAGMKVGGLAGALESTTTTEATIRYSYVEGNVNGYRAVGGIVGWLRQSGGPALIYRCYFDGDVTGKNQGIGGIAGRTESGTKIEECYVLGTVDLDSNDNVGRAGGIVGTNRAEVINCYAKVAVTANHEGDGVAGLIGIMRGGGGDVINSYAAGTVSVDSGVARGLIGSSETNAGDVIDSFWDTGVGPGASAGGTGKTTSEMKNVATFSAWDFVGDNNDDIWDIDTNINDGYPHLGFETKAKTTASGIPFSWLEGHGLPTDGSMDHEKIGASPFTVYEEWIAGTNPNDITDILRMTESPERTPEGFIVRWQSVADRTYTIERSQDLTADPQFETVTAGIQGIDGISEHLDETAEELGLFFYRVVVE